ncbi:elongation factor P [Sandarakinorhabdus sp.]|uniref:elongation factor P n=1 Tax=Sandarakinorhabdus sp. TaxID=1916663 RepID=UPI00286EADBC|nr:elongation factor P [Sandarakinorhabdus sp.]
MVKVIASNIRKGQVIEHDDKHLYVVLKAETFRPGKGTPTTTIDMRRISDGVKTVITTKTSDGLERAFVEEVSHNYLYKDGADYIFINNETYEQISLTETMIGDGIIFLQENAECHILMFDGKPITISLPARVTMAIMATEPVVKGQTASSSYKPATVESGARVMVPPHIDVGTRIVINTEDSSYVERAKD